MGDRADEQPRKLFLGGLSGSTDEDSLKDFFGRFGTIDDCCVIRTSGPDMPKKSRGFGFVTFNSVACVEAVMAERVNGKVNIDGKDVEIKQAMSREDANDNPGVTEKVFKVFVGGIGQLTQDKIRDYFSGFGGVKEVIVKNQEPGDVKKRPYAFVIFDDYEVVDKIVVRKHEIEGTELDCKKANQGGQRGGRGGGPGGRRNDNGYGGGGGRYQGGGGYNGDGGGYSGGNDYYGGAKDGNKDSQGGGYGGSGGYNASGYGAGGGSYGNSGGYASTGGGGYGNGGAYGGGYGASSNTGYGTSAGGYGATGAGGFGSGYGDQGSSYGPMRQQTSGRYGAAQSSSPYGNYGGSGGGGYSSGGGGGRY